MILKEEWYKLYLIILTFNLASLKTSLRLGRWWGRISGYVGKSTLGWKNQGLCHNKVVKTYLFLLLFFIFQISNTLAFGSSFSYKETDQNTQLDQFSSYNNLIKFLNLNNEFKLLSYQKNLNQIVLSDSFLTRFIHIKFEVSGKFELSKEYKTKFGFLVHIQNGDKSNIAIHYTGISPSNRKKITENIKSRFSIEKTTNSLEPFFKSFVSKAYADDGCSMEMIGNTPDFDDNLVSKLSLRNISLKITNCIFNNPSSEKSSLWDGIESFFDDPKSFWDKTVKKTKDTVALVINLTKSFYGNPQKFLSKFSIDLQVYFKDLFTSISELSTEDKLKYLCEFSKDLGASLILAATGVGVAKLGYSIVKWTKKIKNLVSQRRLEANYSKFLRNGSKIVDSEKYNRNEIIREATWRKGQKEKHAYDRHGGLAKNDHNQIPSPEIYDKNARENLIQADIVIERSKGDIVFLNTKTGQATVVQKSDNGWKMNSYRIQTENP